MIPWWHDGTLLWETLILGGEVLGDGAVAAVEADVSRKIDVKLVKGKSGATISDEGYEPAIVQIALKMWLREHWIAWLRQLPIVHPRDNQPSRPLEIIHPVTDALGIATVYVRKIGSPRGEGGGVRVINIEAVQWFPAPKSAKVQKKPKTGGGFDPKDFDVPGPSGSDSPAVFF